MDFMSGKRLFYAIYGWKKLLYFLDFHKTKYKSSFWSTDEEGLSLDKPTLPNRIIDIILKSRFMLQIARTMMHFRVIPAWLNGFYERKTAILCSLWMKETSVFSGFPQNWIEIQFFINTKSEISKKNHNHFFKMIFRKKNHNHFFKMIFRKKYFQKIFVNFFYFCSVFFFIIIIYLFGRMRKTNSMHFRGHHRQQSRQFLKKSWNSDKNPIDIKDVLFVLWCTLG